MDFYAVPPPAERERQLRQGDLLNPVPFVTFSATDAVVLTPDYAAPTRLDLTAVPVLPAQAQLLASVVIGTGIVLNQSCDLTGQAGREKPILLARVLEASERIKDFKAGTDVKKMVGQIRVLANPGRSPSVFYLPEYEDDEIHLQRSVADLLEVVHFPPSNLGALRQIIRLRLSPTALQAFQERLSYCFGRFGAPDHLYFTKEESEQIGGQ